MERPKCRTCPYWDLEDGDPQSGLCLRFPPTFVRQGSALPEHQPESQFAWEFPPMDAESGCGEHPDMPEYIRATRGEGVPSGGEGRRYEGSGRVAHIARVRSQDGSGFFSYCGISIPDGAQEAMKSTPTCSRCLASRHASREE